MDRVRTARALCEEHRSTLTNEHETIAGELAFLDAEGVSSVPGDVNLVVQALRDAGIAHAVPAEHYLAQYRPMPTRPWRCCEVIPRASAASLCPTSIAPS